MKVLLSVFAILTLAGCAALTPGSGTATVTGEAFYLERIAVPPNARLEVVLEDISLADAPAERIGEVIITEAGQPPYPFTIEYDEGQIDPRHSYRVAARLYEGENLLFATDQIHQVITRDFPSDVKLRLRPVREPDAQDQARRLPATFAGTLPCADCPGIDMHLNLLPDGVYMLRESYQGKDAGPFFDIGRYLQSSDGREVILHGGKEAPTRFENLGPDELRLLDRDGQRIESELNYSLSKLAAFEALEPRLLLGGEYRYMAGAARFKECLTGLEMPVATEADNRALQEAYLAAAGEPGAAKRISLEGQLAQRMPMEGPGPVLTLVPERFIGVWPDLSCPPLIELATLQNTYWRLTLLNADGVRPVQNQREPHLVFDEDGRVAGAEGCNALVGSYTTEGSKVVFSQLAATRKACLEGMEQAQAFQNTLDNITDYRIIGNHLEMRDGTGQLRLRFERVAP